MNVRSTELMGETYINKNDLASLFKELQNNSGINPKTETKINTQRFIDFLNQDFENY